MRGCGGKPSADVVVAVGVSVHEGRCQILAGVVAKALVTAPSSTGRVRLSRASRDLPIRLCPHSWDMDEAVSQLDNFTFVFLTIPVVFPDRVTFNLNTASEITVVPPA